MNDEPFGSQRFLVEAAARLLAENSSGDFIRPSSGQYPHQWNWDSAFIAIGLRHLDPSRARSELLALVRGQWSNGMLPHIIYHDGASSYFPNPEFWGTDGVASAPAIPTSGFTQPPILATAVRSLVERSGAVSGEPFAREMFPALMAWHRWLHKARDPNGSGLVAIIHPWESGTDNSPRFVAALDRLGAVTPPPYLRKDQHFVAPAERPVSGDYDLFMHLIGRYRDLAWDDDLLYEEAPFLVQDVLFNSVLHRAERDLLALAKGLGEDTAEIEGWLSAARSGFGRLWDETSGLYFDWDVRADEPLLENTCASLSPLYAGVCEEGRAKRLVTDHLLNEAEYAPGEGSRFFLPSVSKSSMHFEPRRYWRGPIWLNINWLLFKGLREYGFGDEAAALRDDTIDLARRSGFVEYYDPRDGSACGAARFSWSAALVIDLLLEDEVQDG